MERVHVLLVEDDEDDYVLTRDLLADIEQTDYHLHWVTHGKDALAQLRRSGPLYDVCLLDYRLGSETGLDILREAALENISVPVIFLTGQSDLTVDFAAMREGATDFLVKSEINAITLDRSIRYVLAVKRHAQEQLDLALAREAQKQAEAANSSKDAFLAMASHELRAPLNAMVMWVDLLKTSAGEPELMTTALDTIERCARHQTRILDDLLDLTRSINGAMRVEKAPVPLAEIMGNVLDSLRPAAAEKSISLDWSQDAKPCLLLADADRLQQVFGNIVTNSIKFTTPGGLIAVDAEPVELNGAQAVAIRVRDAGAGIAADVLPHVFQRYLHVQGSRSGRAPGVGLGLGLTIAHHLVELHGGTIQVESPGERLGTTVTVTLPLYSAPTG